MAETQFRVPGHLSESSRAFFREVVQEKAVAEVSVLGRLVQACEMLDRADACRLQIETEGVSVTDRFGKQKPNELLEIERRLRTAAADIVQTIRHNYGHSTLTEAELDEMLTGADS